MPAAGERTNASSTLEALIEAAAGGDRGAQQELLATYWPVVRMTVRGRRRLLSTKVRARDETVDLEQEVALKVLLGLPQHEWRGASAFVAWVRELARNEVIDRTRRGTAARRDVRAETELPSQELPAPAPRSMESMADGARGARDLMRDIERLKPEYGAALLMHHGGFSHAEIGEALDCTEEAARKLVSRGRTRLLALRGGS
jgi:RNA polymerase sigma factor (sigma-70 family)